MILNHYLNLNVNCFRVLTNLHSSKKHMTHHTNILNVPRNIRSTTNDSHNTLVLDNANLPIVNKIVPSSSKSNSKSITVDTFIKTINNSSAILASKWYNNSIIPRKIIQVLFNNIQQFNNSFLSLLKKKLLEIKTENPNNSNQIKDMLLMFDAFENPFTNLNSEHLRFITLTQWVFLFDPDQ